MNASGPSLPAIVGAIHSVYLNAFAAKGATAHSGGRKKLRRQTRLVVEAWSGLDFGSDHGGRSDGQDGVPTRAEAHQGPGAAAAELSGLRRADVARLHQP